MNDAARSSGLYTQLAVAFGVAIAVGVGGGTLTDIGPWYQNLFKPSWQPPDWLFGPAWTAIFSLSALAAVLAWRRATRKRDRWIIVILFALNILFNLLWSALFFTIKRPDWALFEVAFLWLSILMLVIGLSYYSPAASALVLPYLAWVTFASVLNYKIVQLNP